MISRIRGIILEKQAQTVLVDVNGVGYELLVPMTTVFDLPDIGKEAVILTHFIVREDAQQLYGFGDEKERELFRVLIRVNGVGPKMALTLMSGMDTDDFVRCVQNDDVVSLTKLPGVGKKTAERLIVEVRDKLADWIATGSDTDRGTRKTISTSEQYVKDAESALIGLGCRPQDAIKIVAGALKQLEQDKTDISSEVLIRMSLKAMA